MSLDAIKAWFKRFGDTATVFVTDLPTTLTLRSTIKRSIPQAALIIGLLVVWTVFAFKDGGWVWLAFGAFGLVTYCSYWLQGVDVVLTVSEKGLETKGPFGQGYEPIRWIRWSDLTRLEYGRGSGGDEDYSPSGMWATGPALSTCVLPGLDEDEVNDLVTRIYRRFPDVEMAPDTGYQGFFGDNLISLNLSGPG